MTGNPEPAAAPKPPSLPFLLLLPFPAVLFAGPVIGYLVWRRRAGALPEPGPCARLRPSISTAGRFTGCLSIAVVWNLGVAFGAWAAFRSWKSGGLDAAVAARVGLAGVAGVVHSLLGLFAPRPSIVPSPPVLRSGAANTMKWRFDRTCSIEVLPAGGSGGQAKG